MNRFQLRLRAVSDSHLDDSAGEMDVCDRARVAFDLTRRALLDGTVTTTEAQEILHAQAAVIQGCDLSLARNVAIQRELDEFTRMLGQMPAHAVARLPQVNDGSARTDSTDRSATWKTQVHLR